jgi:VCBS repeat-containing protein
LPDLISQEFSLDEDDAISSSIANYASDVEQGILSFSLLSTSQNGTTTLGIDGSFQYIPNTNFNGNDNIQVEVCDSENGCTTEMFVFNVLPLNDAPQTQHSQISLPEDTAIQGNLTSLVNDADDETILFAVIENALHGTFIVEESGSFTYAPSAHYFGQDSILFAACDGADLCDSSWIVFTVSLINDAPIVVNEEQQVLMNQSTSGSVALNDLDFDNDVLIYTITGNQPTGIFQLNMNGSYIFTPANDSTGIFLFSYTACDPSGSCDSGTITFYVTMEEEVNTPPAAQNITIQSCAGSSVTIPLEELITDAQEETSALNVVVGTANSGSYQFNSETLTLTYQASQFATGTIELNYYVCDNGVVTMCDTATISIQISPSSTIQITGFQLSQINCYGEANGSISISAQTNSGVVSYEWSNGSNQQTINNLAPGNYSVVITSSAACPVNQTAQFTITQPTELTGTYSLVEANGVNTVDSILVVATGGVPGYSIVWNTPIGIFQNQWSVAISVGGNYSYTITDGNDCQFQDNVLVTSVADRIVSSDLMIYPNPVTDANNLEVQCNGKMSTLELFDSNGSLISIEQIENYKASIDLSLCRSGVYTLRITTAQGIFTRRIVKL